MALFIHCADLHLDRAFQIPENVSSSMYDSLVQGAYSSFAFICSEAVRRKVDFMIISGDLYHHEERSVHAQWFFKKQMKKLQDAGIDVYAVHGNHDPLQKEEAVKLPENVHVFSSEGEVFTHKTPGENVYLYGFSYPDKIYTSSPMAMYRKKERGGLHIGILHGQEASQQEHEPYAPFTLQELRGSGMNYWALGHIHERQVLTHHPPVVYPGCIQGAHRKETGQKGAYLVELTVEKADLHFIPSSGIIWEKIRVSIEEAETLNDVISLTGDLLPAANGIYVCSLELIGRGGMHSWLHSNEKEFLNLVKEEFEHEELLIETVKIKTQPSLQDGESELARDIKKAAVRLQKTPEELEKLLHPLLQHPSVRRHIEEFTNEELEEIINKAETELLLAVQEENG